MSMTRFAVSPVLCLAFLPMAASAQHATARRSTPATTANTPTAPTGMTNEDVIALTSAGLSDQVILAKIRSAPTTSFDTSVTGLKALKAANVSSPVITAMLDPKAPAAATPTPTAVAATPTPSNPDDPASVHAPGIYMYAKSADGQHHMALLERITPKEHKSGGFLASSMTYGIVKAHGRAVLDGAKSAVETADEKPVFYLYIPDGAAGSFGGSSYNPKDFALVKLEVKGDTRQIVTGSYSAWGASSGTDEKSRQGFSSDAVRTGVYKLTPVADLLPGQYAFEQGWGMYFDFGVNGAGQ